MEIDHVATPTIRAAAVLTNSYVAGTIDLTAYARPEVHRYNQLVLYIDFTLGSLTSCDLKIEFGQTASDLYQETDETNAVASNADVKGVNLVTHRLSATGKHRLLIPIADATVRISAIGNGTVTSSSLKITGALAKNFS